MSATAINSCPNILKNVATLPNFIKLGTKEVEIYEKLRKTNRVTSEINNFLSPYMCVAQV